MTASDLLHSATHDAAMPTSLTKAQQSLWEAKAGNWDRAHDLCQLVPDPDGAWIHAHLHREEGDFPNAAYWYHRARRPEPSRSTSIADEWLTLANYFCKSSPQP